MKEVEIHHAGLFTCDECGRDTFVRLIKAELSEEDINEMKWKHGIDPETDGDFMMVPKIVTCDHCGEKFKSLDHQPPNEF